MANTQMERCPECELTNGHLGDCSIPVQDLLCNLAQILDVVKGEWGEAWSAWDQEQRDRITEYLSKRMKPSTPAAPETAPDSPTISLEVYQHDWVPGFAGFLDDGAIAEGAKAHVVLNLGSLLAAIHSGDMSSRQLPYMIAESLMHETIHALESWAKVEFSEDRVEELLAKYRDKYDRDTVWEYTGAEPTPAPPKEEA